MSPVAPRLRGGPQRSAIWSASAEPPAKSASAAPESNACTTDDHHLQRRTAGP